MTPARIDTAIRAEFKKWRSKPRPQKDWGLLWVLSGYDTSWNAYSDTLRRLEEGMRLGKKIAKINGRKFPVLYVSGNDENNTNLKQWNAEEDLKKESSRFSRTQKRLLYPARRAFSGPTCLRSSPHREISP